MKNWKRYSDQDLEMEIESCERYIRAVEGGACPFPGSDPVSAVRDDLRAAVNESVRRECEKNTRPVNRWCGLAQRAPIR